jgi:ribose/xylose/arabinose/galactoside ABC-type transport system permease subunit
MTTSGITPAPSSAAEDGGDTPAAPAERSARRPGGRTSPARLAERYALLVLALAVAVFFSLFPASSGVFPTAANLSVVTGNQSVIAVLALAALAPLATGYFDFSLGATAATASLVCAALMARHGVGLVPAVLAAVATGALIGTLNGFMVARFGMSSFITTLGMATLLGGAIQWYSGGQTISTGVSPALIRFGSQQWLGLPRVVPVVIVLMAAMWFVLGHTPFGRALYAIGSNPRAAKLVGIRVQRNLFTTFVIAGTLAGVAGVLQTARTGGATADTGTSLLFPALAAVFLGATAIEPGRFNVLGTLIGVLFVSESVSGLTLSGASDWVDPVFNGAALLLAVGLSTSFGRKRASGTAP